MGQFRKKPLVVDAVQYDGSKASIAAVLRLDKEFARFGLFADHMTVKTPHGIARVDRGDWVVKGPRGEISACTPDVFAATYEPA